MRSDWDDAPPRLKKSRGSNGVGKSLISILLGLSLGAALLHIAGKPIPFLQTRQPNTQVEQPQFLPPSPSVLEEPKAQKPTAEQMFWSSLKQQEAERKARIKQTDYNDHNYTPRQPDNIVNMEGVRQSSAYQQPLQQTTTRHSATETDMQTVPKWSGGGAYLASWNIVNNYIDGGSVCGNHKRGSIDYRECRKGAKQYFKQECRKWESRYQSDREVRSDLLKQRYCSAASGFSPMG